MKYVVTSDHGEFEKGQILDKATQEQIDHNFVTPVAGFAADAIATEVLAGVPPAKVRAAAEDSLKVK